MSAGADVRFEISRPRVVAEMIDGEVVAIDLDTGSYYSITGTGAVIWQMLEHAATVGEIASALDADTALASSVASFVDDLEREELIRPSTNGTAGAKEAGTSTEPVDIPATDPPRLEKFTDLEDLLLLDPVHDVDTRGWPHTSPS